jgi:NAD(P)-dependent dehydrogenase (short-subunit alcohol dehydrogenase family)
MAAMSSITRVLGYSAAKAAVSNLTQWMAMEMAMKFSDKIRVNALAPGFFIGDQNRALLTNPDGSFTDRGKQVINNTPMGRFGNAEELIGAVLYLVSDSASFVTGVVLPVDGGFSFFSGV